MTSPLHMIQFYLLLRAIKKQGDVYQKALFRAQKSIGVRSNEFRGWAKATSPSSTRTTKMQGCKSSCLVSLDKADEVLGVGLVGEQSKIMGLGAVVKLMGSSTGWNGPLEELGQYSETS